jgi:hypothetical protein
MCWDGARCNNNVLLCVDGIFYVVMNRERTEEDTNDVFGSRNDTVRSYPILRSNLDKLFGLPKGTNLSAMRLHLR